MPWQSRRDTCRRLEPLSSEASWVGCNFYSGRLGRIGMHQLKLQQYGSSADAFSDELESAITFLEKLHTMRLPREVQIHDRTRQPIILCSDASYEPDTPWILPRLGWVIVDPES